MHETSSYIQRQPFTEAILDEPIAPYVKLPMLIMYDKGKDDPKEHIDQFVAAMDLIRPNDAILCKVFLTTLAGRAQTWLSQLAIGSIHCFDQLSISFIHHFAGNRKYPKTPNHLFTIVHRDNESLLAYLKRFTNEVFDVPYLNSRAKRWRFCRFTCKGACQRLGRVTSSSKKICTHRRISIYQANLRCHLHGSTRLDSTDETLYSLLLMPMSRDITASMPSPCFDAISMARIALTQLFSWLQCLLHGSICLDSTFTMGCREMWDAILTALMPSPWLDSSRLNYFNGFDAISMARFLQCHLHSSTCLDSTIFMASMPSPWLAHLDSTFTMRSCSQDFDVISMVRLVSIQLFSQLRCHLHGSTQLDSTVFTTSMPSLWLNSSRLNIYDETLFSRL
ncbi:hypothetical protein BUALT_Bualt10G0047900 [Buddleja alternifolia]|uniref:Retrotransposon gag domain-containing protein n=1 Tax=Buddleja alternifolia TaxID=168488 RepID=A0AAV6X3C7_9LAMI|nr:hypothetical protein BUALT_Bualt10G0047900 [Buddleja alternifolia]